MPHRHVAYSTIITGFMDSHNFERHFQFILLFCQHGFRIEANMSPTNLTLPNQSASALLASVGSVKLLYNTPHTQFIEREAAP